MTLMIRMDKIWKEGHSDIILKREDKIHISAFITALKKIETVPAYILGSHLHLGTEEYPREDNRYIC